MIQKTFDEKFNDAKSSEEICDIIDNALNELIRLNRSRRSLKISTEQLEKILRFKGNEKYKPLITLLRNFGPNVDMTLGQVKKIFGLSSDFLKELLIDDYSFSGHEKIDVLNLLWENIHDSKWGERFVLRFLNDLSVTDCEEIQKRGSNKQCVFLWVAGLGDPPPGLHLKLDKSALDSARRTNQVVFRVLELMNIVGPSFEDWRHEYITKCDAKVLKESITISANLNKTNSL